MKITIRKNTRKGTASVTFRAQNDRDGVALKEAVMGVAGKPPTADIPLQIVNSLIDSGIDRADIDLKIITPKRRKAK